jgi:hypothetical protein
MEEEERKKQYSFMVETVLKQVTNNYVQIEKTKEMLKQVLTDESQRLGSLENQSSPAAVTL